MSAIVGQPKDFVAVPKDALGLDVDLSQFLTALTDIGWSTDDAGAVVAPSGGLSATITFSAGGTFVVTVSGKDKNGAAVSGSTEVVVEVPVPLVASIVVSEV